MEYPCRFHGSGRDAEEILREFHELWNAEQTQKYEDFIDQYKQAYEISKRQREIARQAVSGQNFVGLTEERIHKIYMEEYSKKYRT